MTREEIIKTLRFFHPDEDRAIDWEKVGLNALKALDNARAIAGIPFKVTSNYRTPEHSVEVGGTGTDAHTEKPCSAFDIDCGGFLGKKLDSTKAFKIIFSCFLSGFTRIGINAKNSHIHVDMSKNLPNRVFWIE